MLEVYDDGTGPAIYGAGNFDTTGGIPANNIAKWDGSAWSALGSGADWIVTSLTVFDDGDGPELYAGGLFSTAGGVPANRIARWNGLRWAPVGDGISQNIGDQVGALTVFDDGTGSALYAGGLFTSQTGAPGRFVAKWNGATWGPLDVGLNDYVADLHVFDDGNGAALYAGGRFTRAGGYSSGHIARWGCIPPPRPGDLDGDGDVDLDDLNLMLAAFGACAGEPSYNAVADIDADGCIGLADLTVLLSNYGT